MKYLLVLTVIGVALFIWRHNRREEADDRAEAAAQRERDLRQRRAAEQAARPVEMVTCRHCGLHLPAGDAVKGSLGYYCGPEHRRLHEG